MTFRQLFLRHGRVVGFGFALTYLSSFGQTFFISLSGPGIRDAFGLTHGGFGLVYSTATLSSGLLMIWVGGIIDRINVGLYATVAMLGLSAAALSLSVAPNILALGLSLFALRLCGQGMLSHAGVMSTARLHEGIRGRAVGIATLGFPAGEATLPGLALALIATLGWITTWRIAAAVILVCLLAGWLAGLVLARKDRALPADDPPPAGAAQEPDPAETGPRWIDILRDWRFAALIPSMVGYPAIVTAYFFHQRFIAEVKGWPLELLASSITLFALVAVTATLIAGSLIDRFSAVRLSHAYLLGLAAASLSLALFSGPASAPLFFGLMGFSGITNVVIAAVLAELFGTRHLGRIRALAGALMVVASAMTPGAVGLLFDAAISLEAISLGFAAYLLLAAGVTFVLPNPRARNRALGE